MADVNRGSRPLSPHLTIYRMAITMFVSIANRITGVGLALGCVLIVAWLVAAATSADAYDFVNGWLVSWIAMPIWAGSIWALWFHFLGGLRHYWMDFGRGYDLRATNASAWAVVVGSLILAAVTFALLIWQGTA